MKLFAATSSLRSFRSSFETHCVAVGSIAARQSRAIRCRLRGRERHEAIGGMNRTSQGCRAFRASAVRASGAATCRRSGGSIPPGLRAHQVLGVARPLCRPCVPVTAPSGLRVGAGFRRSRRLPDRGSHSGMARLSRAAIPFCRRVHGNGVSCVHVSANPAGIPACAVTHITHYLSTAMAGAGWRKKDRAAGNV